VAALVLHPPQEGVAGSDNANSIVLAVEYRGRRILLTGDLEAAGLNRLLAEPPRHADVVLAPHHGSRRSSPAAFADWTRPSWVVVSGGMHDDLSVVRATYEAAGGQVLHTAAVGAVQVTIDRAGLRVQALGQSER
jgi:competence protein ComEC